MLRKNYAVLHREKRCNAKIQAKFCYSVLIVLLTLFSSCSKDDPKEQEVIVTVQTEDKTFTIDENPTENQSIGTVPGTTNKGSVTFSIIEQIPVGAFSIDPKTGQLYVDKTSIYDFETNTSITGRIKVENGNIYKESAIVIAINDVDEDIFVGNVELRNQEEVDEFGLKKYREITGDFKIGYDEDSESPIVDLSSLKTIEVVGGTLWVSGTTVLKSLEGLNIVYAYKCVISSNTEMEDISSLQGIMVNSFINVSYNPKITSLGVFSDIESLESGIEITENNSLTSLQGFNNLISTGGGIKIAQNENLNNVFDLNSLTTIGGSLFFNNNPNLINLNGLNNLQTVEGDLWLFRNEHLFDINGLHNLTFVGGDLFINNCFNLQNIEGLAGITSLKHLKLYNCKSLQNLDGLVNLVSLTERLTIQNNEKLNDFCGLKTIFNNGFSGVYTVTENLFNPTVEDMLNDNCSNE